MQHAKTPILGLTSGALLLLAAHVSEASWPPEGMPLCSACVANPPMVCSDGAGGAFVVWTDTRANRTDLYAQRVTSSGDIPPGWPVDGAPVSMASGGEYPDPGGLAPDGFGGFIVAWEDYRNVVEGGTSLDIFAQRVLADGTIAPGWPVDGAPIVVAPGVQEMPIV